LDGSRLGVGEFGYISVAFAIVYFILSSFFFFFTKEKLKEKKSKEVHNKDLSNVLGVSSYHVIRG
jgi:uncharacterized membrane protein